MTAVVMVKVLDDGYHGSLQVCYGHAKLVLVPLA